jgi:hypothetical protein
MPTLSWSALYGANSALSHPGASPDDCVCLPRALFATASRARQRPGLSNMVVDAFDDSLLKSSTIEMTRLTCED